ncbi:MAG: hypothetical protein J7501_11435 [Bdellovibrio sp.]|nr:hypothetical protein [Bdellovibrio sp.]
MRILIQIIFILSVSLPGLSAPSREAAVNIITYWPQGFRVDNTEQGNRVRRLLGKIKALGIDTVILNFRALMVGGTTTEVNSVVAEVDRPEEERLLKDMIRYSRSIGLQVAFRPILLVVGPHGEFPYVDQHGYIWWHGVIRPTDVPAWFESFYKYHERYMRIAGEAGAVWYSIGAEMHSLTSGLGSRSSFWRFGYPELWVDFVQKARTVLGPKVKITYGVNFTDQYVLEDGIRTWGGEFEQWRHDLTFVPKTLQETKHQTNLRKFWQALDFIGLDYYRSLGSANAKYPEDYQKLVEVLSSFSLQYASYLEGSRDQINNLITADKSLAVQEVGYRSVDKCFVSPYLYEGDEAPINYMHQAAAWDAMLLSLWTPRSPWMVSVGIWQVLMDDDSDLYINGGFSPLGKEPTENVLKKYFNER